MKPVKIIAIGDNVCDKFLSRGTMYPGGQCVNTCVYASMMGAQTAYIGKYGSDEAATCVQAALRKFGVDDSRCRHFQGENGFALVTVQDGDRCFLGSNRGGVAKDHAYAFTGGDIEYIQQFHLIYTNLNSYIERELPLLAETGIPIAYDFSDRWDDNALSRISSQVQILLLSCSHLSDMERRREMEKAASFGTEIVVGTVGAGGSWVLWNGEYYYAPSEKASQIRDTMGAGDSYFAAFLCGLLESAPSLPLLPLGEKAQGAGRIRSAMKQGALMAARACGTEGAFGCGVPISGAISL